ncbi:hypothetical protein EYF80_065154 [Liparis tanakae]|uniref:Uncharacterized protein n=1 Tax=Liparis tanakae TaxID=230148 RepID=A0A4Z2E824_9TELE|nr:hypothetical protein EYF80_065154 [Liparis tanakae]
MERSSGTVSAIKDLGTNAKQLNVTCRPNFRLRYPGSACLSRCRCDELPCPLLTWLTTQLTALRPELQGVYNI